MKTQSDSAKLAIYDHMIMNQQSVSVKLKNGFADYFDKKLGIREIKTHIGNVYLFSIPLAGEFTTLDLNQKQFIFEKELGLYEEQFEVLVPFSNSLFEQFFEITWHGVIYHAEIKSLWRMFYS